jgi:hypothetical protein
LLISPIFDTIKMFTMAQAGDDSSEWTTVTKTSKRCAGKRSRRSVRKVKSSANHQSTSSSLTLEDIEKSLDACLEELRKSIFFQNFQESLKALPSYQFISAIVCYGIGNFGASKNCAPMWQLSFAIAVKEFLAIEQQALKDGEVPKEEQSISVLYFDPCMSQLEAIFLERHGIQIIAENERGKRKTTNTTLFFMPHCPMMLYSNVIFTNWERISDVIIFGNLLSTYTNRLGKAKASVKLLRLLEPHWEEVVLPINKQDIDDRPAYFEQAFNDSSLTHFSTNQGCVKWPDRPEDACGDDDGGETI